MALLNPRTAQSWSARKVVGVDIDDSLVRAAWRRRRAVWSLQSPSDKISINSAGVSTRNLEKRKRHSTESTAGSASRIGQPDYFPISCEHEFGSLPVPASKTRGRHMFPHNVSFRTADWTCTEIPEDAERYNVVIACQTVTLYPGLLRLTVLPPSFSISKWIHLNGGDEALKTFFRRVYDVLEPGGTFVLEPQSWDTYAKAKRMDEVGSCGSRPPLFLTHPTVEIEREFKNLTNTP
jgi:Bicoid-interacting protein 3 (Bin3)